MVLVHSPAQEQRIAKMSSEISSLPILATKSKAFDQERGAVSFLIL